MAGVRNVDYSWAGWEVALWLGMRFTAKTITVSFIEITVKITNKWRYNISPIIATSQQNPNNIARWVFGNVQQ